MDLPFAVDSSPERRTSLHHSNASSLVTASSQGSLLPDNSSPEQSSVFSSSQEQSQSPYSNTIIAAEENDVTDDMMNDFTYVNVCETEEVDVFMDGLLPSQEDDNMTRRGDVLTVLLSGGTRDHAASGESIVDDCERANEAACKASEAKRKDDLTCALNAHSEAAKVFREAAVRAREGDVSLSNSLLLLSQAQAKSALALKRFLKQHPEGLQRIVSSDSGDATITSSLSQKERLRATVRGALDTRNEADISDSVFLGRASSSPPKAQPAQKNATTTSAPSNTDESIVPDRPILSSPDMVHNPVDEMMELERELRDMDMALEMGNSIMSLGARTQNRLKHSTMEDGSFMMVPPGSSYMSSSLWASGIATGPRHPPPSSTNTTSGTAGARARANRVQNILDASTTAAPPSVRQVSTSNSPQKSPHGGAAGLESSWWGTSSTMASQALSSSIMSLGGSRVGAHGTSGDQMAGQPANTKQMMRLLDSIKTLGDENAALLREVEDAEAARAEAKAIKEQMRRFKAEYGKRFALLKSALEKFRKSYPEGSKEGNPVSNSDFLKTSEQIQRLELQIRKLTADLEREKEESRKKNDALRKYENFYRAVKARSAEKAAQRKREAQQRQRPNLPTSRVPAR